VRRERAGLFPRTIFLLFDLIGPESLFQHRWPSSRKT
jgi:hypothetical protein